MLAHCICYLNSAINPIIYNHMNSKSALSQNSLGNKKRPYSDSNSPQLFIQVLFVPNSVSS